MWCKIKEYSLKWREEKNSDKDVKLNFIGMKLLLFRRSIDKNIDKQANFLPYFGKETIILLKELRSSQEQPIQLKTM